VRSTGLQGITRKLVYAQTAAPLLEEDATHYMVKPYHERVSRRLKGWMHYPIQGWAEMANQGLYHAAGIGHLHQKVHVDEHDMGEGTSASRRWWCTCARLPDHSTARTGAHDPRARSRSARRWWRTRAGSR
jgi:hypothetical protein